MPQEKPTPNGTKTPNGTRIPTYLPFDQAARRYGLSPNLLTQQIQAGKIAAVKLPSGELLVAADNTNGQDYQTKDEIIAAHFAHLRGQTINAYQAQQKYGIRYQNFIKWARTGYINILREEDRLFEMDEADVAYCAYVYRKKEEEYKGRIAGVRIFNDDGNPYQLKYPDLAAQRRK
jgi:hypothetical protein